jgi:UDP-N-acetylmuramate: L-alanyl-gamma-D-glutamyl-meso-diaminopimelate ligase
MITTAHNAYLSFSALKQKKESIKNIFFYRICGTGMGAAACLLKEMGMNVEGGDLLFTPPMSDYLQSTLIPLHHLKDCGITFLQQFDLIVVGNVVPKNSEDATKIETSGVPFTSFPTALGALLLSEQNVVGIAGTHGKTTTTYLAVQLFEKLGFRPGYLIGGVLNDRPSSQLGDGSYFFIESDEYDSAYFEKHPKFHSYALKHLLLTSLEYDHADIYPNVEAIEQEFIKLINHLKKTLILNQDYLSTQKVTHSSTIHPDVAVYAYGEQSGCGPHILQMTPQKTVFELIWKQTKNQFETNLTGPQNILNLSAVILFAFSQGLSAEMIRPHLRNFKMVKRRQEIVGRYKNALFIDDFAHHPRAMALTLDGIRTQYPNQKMLVLFEPASATARSTIFQNEFTDALKAADGVIIIRPARRSQIPLHGDIDGHHILQRLQKENHIPGCLVENVDDLVKVLDDYLDNPIHHYRIVVTLSNGNLSSLWARIFPQQSST